MSGLIYDLYRVAALSCCKSEAFSTQSVLLIDHGVKQLTHTDDTKALHDLLTMFLIIQTRVNNIPLFLIFTYQLRALDLLGLRSDEITLTCSMLQFASFFALGGANAISSVDLSSAYNGIDGYNVVAVGILTFVSNWAGPIWWSTGAILLLLNNHDRNDWTLIRHLCLLTVITASSLVFVMAACTMLRTHLFVWTVFSPKYLYSMAWSLGQHICINIGLGTLLWRAGYR